MTRKCGISYLQENYLFIVHDGCRYYIKDLNRLKKGHWVDLLYLMPPIPPAVGYARLVNRTIQVFYNTINYFLPVRVLEGKEVPLLREDTTRAKINSTDCSICITKPEYQ